MRGDLIQNLKSKIESATGMQLTVTCENDNRDVEFLDCVFHRNEDNTVSHKWLKKSYSSLSIMNYHSVHPDHVKLNTVREMIARARYVTSPVFQKSTDDLLRRILVNSS